MKRQITGSGILSKHRKMAVSITAAVLLVFLYLLIFGFSGQTGEESGGLSRMITEKCVEFINTLSGKHWSQILVEELTAYFEHPVRKLAHFTEYACMGVLVYLMWRPWKKRDRRLVLLVLVWVFLSAAGDEFYQRFVPGRYGCFADVILDTCGGGAGVCFCILCEKVWNGRRKRLRTEKGRTGKNKTEESKIEESKIAKGNTGKNKAEKSKTAKGKTEKSKAEKNKTEQNNTEQ